MQRKNVLIFDPDRDVSELFARALETRKDCKCYLAGKEGEVIDLLRDIVFDLILVDITMVTGNEFGLLKRIKRLHPGTAVVVHVYLQQKEQIKSALEHGASGYIIKPIKVDEFRKKIQDLFAAGTP